MTEDFNYRMLVQSSIFEKTNAQTVYQPLTKEVLDAIIDNEGLIALAQRIKDADGDKEKQNRLKMMAPALLAHAKRIQGEKKNENVTEESHIVQVDLDNMETDPPEYYEEHIRGREEELRIYGVYVSLRLHGLKLFVERRFGDIGQTQEWVAREVGLEKYLDKSCKDLVRSAFLPPRSYWLHISDGMFEEPEQSLPFVPTVERMEWDGGGGTIGEYQGIPLKDIYEKWVEQHGGAPNVGTRNPFIHRALSAFKAITDNDEEVLSRIIPHYGLSDKEYKHIMKSALKEPAKRIWKELQHCVDVLKGESDEDPYWYRIDTELIEELSRKVFKHLPIGIKETIQRCTENRKMQVFSALMPILGTYADGVELTYVDGSPTCTGLMTGVVGMGSGGKSGIRRMLEPWFEPLREEATEAAAAIDEWKEEATLRASDERGTKKPKPLVRWVAASASKAYLLEMMKNAQGHTVFTFTDEVNNLNSGTGSGWDQLSILLRAAFEQEHFDRGLYGLESVSYCGPVKWNITAMGTVGAWRDFFPDRNTENGLATRFLLTFMPDVIGEKMAIYKPLTDDAQKAIDKAIQILSNRKGEVSVPRISKAIGKWIEGKRQLAETYQDAVLDSFFHRAANIGFRIAVLIHLLTEQERESKTAIDCAILMAEYALQGQLMFHGDKIARVLAENPMPAVPKRFSWESLIKGLPENFTYEEAKKAYDEKTSKTHSKDDTLHRLRDQVSKGLITTVGDNRWKRL